MSWATLPYIDAADNRVKIFGYEKIDTKKIETLLSQSPIKAEQIVRVFIVPRWLMVLVNPLQGLNSQGVNYPYLDFVFIYDKTANNSARSLEGAIVHEVTHTDIT